MRQVIVTLSLLASVLCAEPKKGEKPSDPVKPEKATDVAAWKSANGKKTVADQIEAVKALKDGDTNKVALARWTANQLFVAGSDAKAFEAAQASLNLTNKVDKFKTKVANKRPVAELKLAVTEAGPEALGFVPDYAVALKQGVVTKRDYNGLLSETAKVGKPKVVNTRNLLTRFRYEAASVAEKEAFIRTLETNTEAPK
jgi:hypothetical protein